MRPQGVFLFHSVIYIQVFDCKIIQQEFAVVELLSSLLVRHYVHMYI